MKIIGVILIAIAVLCIIVGRNNYSRLGEINKAVRGYQEENPISSLFFGVPLTDVARAEARGAASFAYSFTPPLSAIEILVYAMLIAGAILTWAGTTKKNPEAEQSDAANG